MGLNYTVEEMESFLDIAYRTKSKGLILKFIPKEDHIKDYFIHESIIESFYINISALCDTDKKTI